MYRYKLPFLILGLLASVAATRCTVVRAYEKQFLNDYTMQENHLPVEKLDSEATSYREGASGGESGKTGGGCGCN